MLHGCRTDLILKCVVYSIKDRNFFLLLLIKQFNIDLMYFVNINFNKKIEIKKHV